MSNKARKEKKYGEEQEVCGGDILVHENYGPTKEKAKVSRSPKPGGQQKAQGSM